MTAHIFDMGFGYSLINDWTIYNLITFKCQAGIESCTPLSFRAHGSLWTSLIAILSDNCEVITKYDFLVVLELP